MTDHEFREALPDRYLVAKRGTQDPESSQYYVLDVIHDGQARAQLRGLVRAYRLYGSSVAADELEAFLDATQQSHRETVEARLAKATGKPKLSGKTARRKR